MSYLQFGELLERQSNRISECTLNKLIDRNYFEKPKSYYDKPLADIYLNVRNSPVDGNNGRWNGERGNSSWYPDQEFCPGKSNPEGKAWNEILNKFGIDYIPFKEGEPDFNRFSKGSVEINSFSSNRTDNFDKADIEFAKQKGWSPEEVELWRKENRYTWHECKDMKTMQMVPSEVHNNIPHRGGISEVKKGSGDDL